MSCPSCAHHYRIREAHIRRTVDRDDQPQANAGADPLLAGAPEPAHARTGERLDTDAQGNVIGLSGLSEMMRRESRTRRPQRTVASPPLAELRVSSLLHRFSRMDPRRRVAYAGVGLGIGLLGITLFIIILVAVTGG